MDPITTAELMMPGEAARLFGVTPNTVARWADAGKIRQIKTPGGYRRYFAEDVRALAGADAQAEFRAAAHAATEKARAAITPKGGAK
jgi:excisionase family DNA binding protein